QAEREARERALQASLPGIELTNPTAWEAWKDEVAPWENEVITRYATLWAGLMQAAVANGSRIDEVALQTSQKARAALSDYCSDEDHDDTVMMLVECWPLGEELRL